MLVLPISTDTDRTGFVIEGIPAKFMTTASPFTPGDRVRITITEEPAPNDQSRT